MKTIETVVQDNALDLVFNERPYEDNDWDTYINSSLDEVQGFQPCEEYELDNAHALRGVLQTKLNDFNYVLKKLADAELISIKEVQ